MDGMDWMDGIANPSLSNLVSPIAQLIPQSHATCLTLSVSNLEVAY